MLANHVAMHMARIDVEMLAKEGSQARSIEGRSGAEHSAGWNTELSREVRGEVSHDVHRIGDHQQHGLRRVAQNRRHDLPEYVRVALQKLKPRFTGFLGDSTSDHHDLCTDEIRVV